MAVLNGPIHAGAAKTQGQDTVEVSSAPVERSRAMAGPGGVQEQYMVLTTVVLMHFKSHIKGNENPPRASRFFGLSVKRGGGETF